MGCYVNPKGETKEAFLKREGRPIRADEAVIANGEYPVCLIDSGIFTAAAVAFSKGELYACNDESDIRPKAWFMVPRSALLAVSDIEDYVDVTEFMK